jgi:putative FmdB family regulatory protein
MPLYVYECRNCGLFEAWQEMRSASDTCACPDCGSASERQLAMPSLSTMNGSLRAALARAEKSSSEPRVASRSHLANCGCRLCSGFGKPAPTSRRWMIGH